MNKKIDIVPKYSNKAHSYHQHRWSFDQQAIRALLAEIDLLPGAIVADIGCGTGMSSQPFLQEGYQVYGIEPNPEMRRIAKKTLSGERNFHCLSGRAEVTGLPDSFADLLVAGRALHWFPQTAARAEFARISKPDGWLAIMSVRYADEALQEAWRSLHRTEYGWDVQASKQNRPVQPLNFFFDAHGLRKLHGMQTVCESWEEFFSRMLTMSTAPDPQNQHFARFETHARAMFDKFRQGDELVFQIKTEVVFGHPAPS